MATECSNSSAQSMTPKLLPDKVTESETDHCDAGSASSSKDSSTQSANEDSAGVTFNAAQLVRLRAGNVDTAAMVSSSSSSSSFAADNRRPANGSKRGQKRPNVSRDMTDEEKKAERRAANRRSAFQSRQRRKMLIDDLQRTVAGLSKDNHDLRKISEELQTQLEAALLDNHRLRMQQQQLAAALGAKGMPDNAHNPSFDALRNLAPSMLRASVPHGTAGQTDATSLLLAAACAPGAAAAAQPASDSTTPSTSSAPTPANASHTVTDGATVASAQASQASEKVQRQSPPSQSVPGFHQLLQSTATGFNRGVDPNASTTTLGAGGLSEAEYALIRTLMGTSAGVTMPVTAGQTNALDVSTRSSLMQGQAADALANLANRATTFNGQTGRLGATDAIRGGGNMPEALLRLLQRSKA